MAGKVTAGMLKLKGIRFTAVIKERYSRHTNGAIERLNREIRRCKCAVETFSSDNSPLMFVTASLKYVSENEEYEALLGRDSSEWAAALKGRHWTPSESA